jgi:hypothetical protein
LYGEQPSQQQYRNPNSALHFPCSIKKSGAYQNSPAQSVIDITKSRIFIRIPGGATFDVRYLFTDFPDLAVNRRRAPGFMSSRIDYLAREPVGMTDMSTTYPTDAP